MKALRAVLPPVCRKLSSVRQEGSTSGTTSVSCFLSHPRPSGTLAPSGTHVPSGDPHAHQGPMRPEGTLAPQHQKAWVTPALILSHWTWGVFAAVIVKTFCL